MRAERLERERVRGITDAALAARAAAQRQVDTAKFLETALERLVAELGEESGKAELRRALAAVGVPVGDNGLPAEMDSVTRRKVDDALTAARWERQEVANREARAQAAENARRAALARCQGQLEDAALAHFRRDASVSDPSQWAQVWLRNKQTTLKASPLDYATDRDRLSVCLNLLTGPKVRR